MSIFFIQKKITLCLSKICINSTFPFFRVPVGLPDVSHYPELFVALLDSGSWGVDDIKKLAGQNFLRVLMEVEQVPKEGF